LVSTKRIGSHRQGQCPVLVLVGYQRLTRQISESSQIDLIDSSRAAAEATTVDTRSVLPYVDIQDAVNGPPSGAGFFWALVPLSTLKACQLPAGGQLCQIRRNGMDSRTFDSLLRLSATRTGRRRLFQAGAAVGVGGLLTRAGMEEVVAACQSRRHKCSRNDECSCKDSNVICDRLPNKCNRSGDRCCGTSKASCKANCDCCKGFVCNDSGKCTQAG
jgi:hypothetical protein